VALAPPTKPIHQLIERNNMHELTLNLSLEEVMALHKTLGIAIDNLSNKMFKHIDNKNLLKASQVDMQLLVAIQQQVLDIITEVE
jgi:hypothetical protein